MTKSAKLIKFTLYRIACFTCKESGPLFASASIAYGYKVWDSNDVNKWLGHGQSVGLHEGHDLRIVSEHIELPWEEE